MLIFPLVNDTSRKIIHIDMDAFFASVEERDYPELKGKPVIIGHDPRLSGGRGVVSTCNYEARKYGVPKKLMSVVLRQFSSLATTRSTRLSVSKSEKFLNAIPI